MLFSLLAVGCMVCNLVQKLAAKLKPYTHRFLNVIMQLLLENHTRAGQKCLKRLSAGSSDYEKRSWRKKATIHEMIVVRELSLLTETYVKAAKFDEVAT